MIPVDFTEERHGFRQYIVPRTFSEKDEILIGGSKSLEQSSRWAAGARLACKIVAKMRVFYFNVLKLPIKNCRSEINCPFLLFFAG